MPVPLRQLGQVGASDAQMMHWNNSLGEWEPTDVKSSLSFNEAPTANGLLYLIGWYIRTDSAASLTSAGPVTMAEPAYHSHIVLDISAASGLPFTVRLTGTSINEITGATTASDTEDINVTANGFHQSVKSWVDAVQISIVEGSKSCTIDVNRVTYWDRGNLNYTVSGARFEWTPDAVSWSIQFRVLHVEDDGSVDVLDDVTFANGDSLLRAEKDKPGKHKRGDYSHAVNGANKEGVILEVTQSGIGQFLVELKYDGRH